MIVYASDLIGKENFRIMSHYHMQKNARNKQKLWVDISVSVPTKTQLGVPLGALPLTGTDDNARGKCS